MHVPQWAAAAVLVTLSGLVAMEVSRQTEGGRGGGHAALSAPRPDGAAPAGLGELRAVQANAARELRLHETAIADLELRVSELEGRVGVSEVHSKSDPEAQEGAGVDASYGVDAGEPPGAERPHARERAGQAPPDSGAPASANDKNVCSMPPPAPGAPIRLRAGSQDEWACPKAKVSPVSVKGLVDRLADVAGWTFPLDSIMNGVLDGAEPSDFKKMQNGDTVFLPTVRLPLLANELRRRNIRVDLITGADDEGVPLKLARRTRFDWQDLLAKHVRVWITQNFDLNITHPRIIPMPIGIDIGREGSACDDALQLERTRDAAKPFGERKPTAAMTWMSITSRDRMAAQKKLRGAAGVEELQQMSRENLWMRMAEHKFVISPTGGGLDSYRTWEALALGCVPIVKRTVLTAHLFGDLPVVAVDDWDEVTPANLAKWAQKHAGGVPTSAWDLDVWTRRLQKQRYDTACGGPN